MTEKASNFTGDVPGFYDRFLGPRIFMDFARDLADRVARSNPSAVLELAAGTGIVSRKLRDTLAAECQLVATDLNEPMLDAARAKFGQNENIKLEQADAQSLPYEDESFDLVTCQFGVMFFPDKPGSYREAHRIMKPGGRYVFNVWDSWEANPFAQLAHEATIQFFPENPPGFYKVPFGYRDVPEIESAIMDAGFTSLTHEVVSLQSGIPSAKEFATGLVYGNPLCEEIHDRGGNPEDVVTAIARTLDENLGGQMPLQAIVFEAMK